ncbi:MAG: hypothetical protein ACYS80_10745 [Planctomycetota bacterium]|jgi:hypothetical protein
MQQDEMDYFENLLKEIREEIDGINKSVGELSLSVALLTQRADTHNGLHRNQSHCEEREEDLQERKEGRIEDRQQWEEESKQRKAMHRWNIVVRIAITLLTIATTLKIAGVF